MKRYMAVVCVVAGFPANAQVLDQEQFAARAGSQASQINCAIRPLQTVEINSGIDGIIAQVFVKPGSVVAEGDPLMRLDDAVAIAELNLADARAQSETRIESAKLRLAALQSKEERLARARARLAVSLAEYDTAKLERSDAEADLNLAIEQQKMARIEAERARVVVQKTYINSTVSGIVGEDLADPGEGTSNRVLATIYVNKPLRVEAFVPAQQIDDFLAQEQFEIIVNGRAEQTHPITFDYAAQVADLASNTIGVFFRLDAADVRPGSKCYLEIK